MAIINFGLEGFETIDLAKACPGKVSCADILAFAARDAVVLVGGSGWNVPAGRKDGKVSIGAEPETNLPHPKMSVSELIANFAAKGLSAAQMVDMSVNDQLQLNRSHYHCLID